MELGDLRQQFEQMEELLSAGATQQLRAKLSELHPEDIADLLPRLEKEQREVVLGLLDAETASQVIAEVDAPERTDILLEMGASRLSELVDEMASNEAAEVIAELPEDLAGTVLTSLSQADAAEVKALLGRKEGSAGRLMSTEIVKVDRDATVQEAIESIRKAADEVENIQYVYVVNHENILMGLLPLRELLLTKSGHKVFEIMETGTISVNESMDQEEVANTFRKYHLTAAPVVDSRGRLVGRITADDIVDVIAEEDSEDVSLMAGAVGEEIGEYAPLKISRGRLPWLIVGLVGGLCSAALMHYFSPAFHKVLALAFFVPVITAMGGNIGIQSASLTARGLATGEIQLLDAWRRFFRELKVALLNGMICGALLGVVAGLWHGNLKFGAIIGGALLVSTTVAATVGTSVPLLLKRVGVDPAVAAGPFVTISNDILGLFIYLGLATALLSWL